MFTAYWTPMYCRSHPSSLAEQKLLLLAILWFFYVNKYLYIIRNERLIFPYFSKYYYIKSILLWTRGNCSNKYLSFPASFFGFISKKCFFRWLLLSMKTENSENKIAFRKTRFTCDFAETIANSECPLGRCACCLSWGCFLFSPWWGT